jgi:hypothetical protein
MLEIENRSRYIDPLTRVQLAGRLVPVLDQQGEVAIHRIRREEVPVLREPRSEIALDLELELVPQGIGGHQGESDQRKVGEPERRH